MCLYIQLLVGVHGLLIVVLLWLQSMGSRALGLQ